MDERRSLGVFGAGESRDERGDAGSDIRAHGNVNALIQRDEPRYRHGNGHGGHDRRALQKGGEQCTDEDEQSGIAEHGKKVFYRIQTRKIAHGAAHHREPREQHSEARDNSAQLLRAVLFGKGEDKCADPRERGENDRRGNGVFAEQPQRDQLSRNGGAHVRAENDRRRLRKRHDARVHEADHHDGRCARTLNDRRGGGAHAYAQKFTLCRFGEQGFQAAAARGFEVGAHHIAGD